MNSKLSISGRFALCGVTAAAMFLATSSAWSLGLGRLQVQSALGESLKAEIDITSLSAEEAANLRVRVAPPESYRAAGVDYNAVLAGAKAELQRRADGRSFLRLSSDRSVQEPFVDVILEITWSTGRLVREYTLLFDPPSTVRAPGAAPAPAPAAVTVAPLLSPAPTAAPIPPAPLVAAPAPPRAVAEQRPVQGARAAASTPVRESRPAAKAPQGGADEYKVKPGDSLSRIASRTQRPGASLDQMLVSLYRGNPQAFVDNNMNRLRSGVVLQVPAAETAQSVSPSDARQLIQAQSSDFGAYRERLAAGVAPVKSSGSAQQAVGKVQAKVEDRKPGVSSADKLTLSKGAATAKAAEQEDKISKERAKKADELRLAELAKNVEQLKKLSTAPASAAPAKVAPTAPAKPSAPVAAVTVPASAPPVLPVPGPVAKAPSPPVVSPPAVASAVVSKPTTASAPLLALAPSAPASAPVSVASAASASASASSSVLAAASASSASRPVASAVARPASSVPALVPESSFLGSLLDENPLALGVGGLAVLALAGLGFYRFTKRPKKDSGETSFLESRLQPDSFFGASGGQRIDTRDAGGNSSSMSYSLSQLDAIGDVDPVAEADVYLAYGRDLQAEEILKEAMRSTPDRLAIRTKLLEVYAKRRDTKGFELLATQLFALTRGEGEDWAKTQELGAQIDPDNPLFQPGGAPSTPLGQAGEPIEPLGASTMPQSVLPSPSQFGPGVSSSVSDSQPMDLDLDLDLSQVDLAATTPAALDAGLVATQAIQLPGLSRSTDAAAADGLNIDFAVPDLPEVLPASTLPLAEPSAFDLSEISLDLDGPVKESSAPVPQATANSGFTDLDMPSLDGDEEVTTDPLARKLELAEEFRQIGDLDGARDLLHEVVAKSSGAVKSRAQNMLSELG